MISSSSQDISIHSALAGTDEKSGLMKRVVAISIHSARVGADREELGMKQKDLAISIHSARVGTDSKIIWFCVNIIA